MHDRLDIALASRKRRRALSVPHSVRMRDYYFNSVRLYRFYKRAFMALKIEEKVKIMVPLKT